MFFFKLKTVVVFLKFFTVYASFKTLRKHHSRLIRFCFCLILNGYLKCHSSTVDNNEDNSFHFYSFCIYTVELW